MRLVPGLMLVCAVFGCRAAPSAPELDELRTVPTSVMLEGESFELPVALYRDFMPSSPPNGRPLAAVVRLPDRLTTVRVERIWVLLDDEVWSAEAEQVPGTQDWVARDGPKWGPGILVDVVAQLRQPGREGILVRAPNRLIQRTD